MVKYMNTRRAASDLQSMFISFANDQLEYRWF